MASGASPGPVVGWFGAGTAPVKGPRLQRGHGCGRGCALHLFCLAVAWEENVLACGF